MDDISPINPEDFTLDPSRRHDKREPELFDEYIPNLLRSEISKDATKTSQPNASVKITLPIAAPAPPAPAVAPVPVIAPAPTIRVPTPPLQEFPSPVPTPESSPDQSAQNSDSDYSFDIPDSPVESPAPFRFDIESENDDGIEFGPATPQPTRIPRRVAFKPTVSERLFLKGARAQTTPVTEPDYFVHSRVSSDQPSTSQAEKRKAITDSVARSKQSKIPTGDTKLDQVKSSILKHKGEQPLTPLRTPVYLPPMTRSKTKQNLSINSLSNLSLANFVRVSGNVLNNTLPFAHCVNS